MTEVEPTRGNTVDRVVDEIRSLILNGQLPPGFRLRESALAESVGVSRTPVREALSRLASEGLVEVRPNRGAAVRAVPPSETQDVAGIRATLEGMAARGAAERITADQLAELEKFDGEMHQLVRSLSDENDENDEIFEQLAALNERFHEIVRSAANNPTLQSISGTFRLLPLARRTFRHYDPVRLRRSMSSHSELVEALRSRNGDWAEAVTRAHIWSAAAIQRYDGESRMPHES
ncbi:GntR family transcriptional regulator [Streptomyces sp. NPDC050619]|uniref:GntR family transcriptional regulator n=1 Tax=Streptomyces sp. NPDC050619 TaxID=3157214 RepID=UPI0034322213